MRGAFRRPFLMVASLLAFAAPIALLAHSAWRYVSDKVGRWQPWRSGRLDSKEYFLTRRLFELKRTADWKRLASLLDGSEANTN